ncbi:MAG: SDR family NAD(P)-dependent oxidoreductase [Phototrophicales bacterium]|nr:SDR family NAD(P)-dependent oxidoreductase [Phototrophicales bacterium]
MPYALIWGASGGMGSAITTLLKNKGWSVFGVARDESKIPAIADGHFTCDANDPASFDQAVSLIARQADGIDLMVYAIGGIKANLIEKMPLEDWQSTFNINLHGAFYATRAGLDLMNKDGHLMFIGAYPEKIILPRMSAYTSAKSALASYVSILRKEQRKLKVTLVRPPAVNTPFWVNVPFNMPDYALSAQSVAESVYLHYDKGIGEELNL